MIDKIGIAILTMFGIGRSKFAPGTLASLVTCLLYFLFFFYKPNYILVIIIFLIFSIYSIVLIDRLEKKFSKKDPREIVIDEFIGQSIPIIVIYTAVNVTGSINEDWNTKVNFLSMSFLIIFLLFRFFDILKPFPINIIDKKLKNGLGVVLDDVVAGIYTTLIYFIAYYLYYGK